eukprot:TRINITY_DN48882_c0_g1_i1.p1 TRINITY_DN48882_c0_g1~~TRINITY_DN48882_c0_g1_i1.p1  ORF type:complete len:1796 (-),score=488.50 TRINITY_DN48882_c0_g1_i1:87-5474(-)
MAAAASPPAPAPAAPAPAAAAADHDSFVGELIDKMRKQRQDKSRRYRNLPYFQHLGSDEVFEALDRVRQANLLQMQLKMQKDCAYMQHMDDTSLEGKNAENIRKRVQDGKLQGGFRQIQAGGFTSVCGCLDCQLRLGNKQFNSSWQYEQSREQLSQRVGKLKLSFLGAVWNAKSALTTHLASELNNPAAVGQGVSLAVAASNVDLLKMLCGRHMCNINAPWSDSEFTALDLAVAKGSDECGEVLLNHGAELRHFQHETLADAVERNSSLLLRALLQQHCIMASHGFAPMWKEAAEQVLNRRNSDGNTPLHLACSLENRGPLVKMLIAHKAEFNLVNADGMTPLDCCVKSNNLETWNILKTATGDKAKHRLYDAEAKSLKAAVASNSLFLIRNHHDGKGKVDKSELGDLLHLAVRTNGMADEVVQMLVDQGADVNKMKDGMSVLDACLLHNHVSEATLGRQARLACYAAYTLHKAVKGGHVGLSRYVANTKAGKEDLNVKEGGRLPLHTAAASGFVDIVRIIMKMSNVNVHDQTDDGKTALDLACEKLSQLNESEVGYNAACQIVDLLLSRSCKLKQFKDETQLTRAKTCVQKLAEKEKEEAKTDAKKTKRQEKEKSKLVDEQFPVIERDIKALVVEEIKKADLYKEMEKLARKVADAQEVLQASWRGDGSKLPEYSSSKYYQIRIDVLKRKITEKDGQIEEALKKMDFAEEDYLWLLRKKMRDLRLKYHPDKIQDRAATDEDYKFYERITKAYDVLCTKEERDKYLEMSNHVEWLQQHGDEEEARLVEKAIHDMEVQKKPKKEENKDENPAQPKQEHMERAKKKLQERRDEDNFDKQGDKMRALTFGTPNRCKAPVVTQQRWSEKQDECWIDLEWVCRSAYVSAERIEYELQVQSIDKGEQNFSEVHHVWETAVIGLGPFFAGTYEFMVRARNSAGWGDWSDVVIISLDDPILERQLKKEEEKAHLKEHAQKVQADLQRLVEEYNDMQSENKLTIQRASNLLHQLQGDLKRGRQIKQHLPNPRVVKEAEATMKALEDWRDRKEAFGEWRQVLTEMKNQLFAPVGGEADEEEESKKDKSGAEGLETFLNQDTSFFGSLGPEVRNLIVQTLLGLDNKAIYKKLTAVQKDSIVSVLKRGVDLGRSVIASEPENPKEKGAAKAGAAPKKTIFTKTQNEQLQALADRFAAAPCPGDVAAEKAAAAAEAAAQAAAEEELAAASAPAVETPAPEEKEEKKMTRTLYLHGLPESFVVSRNDLINTLKPFGKVDGARISGPDALVRFSTETDAKKALLALQRADVYLYRYLVSGKPAESDMLTEEALCAASGKTPALPEQLTPEVQPGTAATALQSTSTAHAPPALPPPTILAGSKLFQSSQPSMAPAPAKPAEMLVSAAPAVANAGRANPPAPPPKSAPASLLANSQSRPAAAEPPVAGSGGYGGAAVPPRVSTKLSQAALEAQAQAEQQSAAKVRSAARPAEPQRTQLAHSESAAPAVSSQPARTSRRSDVGKISQSLLFPNEHVSMFVCPVCDGVAWRPKVTQCCQKLVCSGCLEDWLQTNARCPHIQCQSPIVPDGSTGLSDDISPRPLDNRGSGVHEFLWRIYNNLRMRCPKNCGWTGGVVAFADHMQACGRETPSTASTASRQEAASPAKETEKDTGPVNKVWGVVMAHEATGQHQLSVQPGDQVLVRQIIESGWAFGRRTDTGESGWFPFFCLPTQEEPPPEPEVKPPPPAPPVASVKVVANYIGTQAGQLTVASGEAVRVKKRESSGWTLITRVAAVAHEFREGWVPDWCLGSELS